MKKSISIGTCTAVVGFAAALFAQTQPPPQTTTPSGSDQKVTIVGCLRAAPGSSDTAGAAGAAGTTGTTGTAGTTGTSGAAEPGDAKYVLTDATVKPADAAAPSATPSETTSGAATTTGAAASASGAGQTYRLIANPAALTPHVGKKLELTGTIENDNGSSSAAPSGTTASAGAAGSSEQGPKLRVESGKVLAASCSPQ